MLPNIKMPNCTITLFTKNNPMATTKELMDFITFLDNRGLLTLTPEKHDYEKAIWEFEKTMKPKDVAINK